MWFLDLVLNIIYYIMVKNLELQIASLRRHIFKQDEQIQHNAIYFDNKIKAIETAYKQELNILVFSTNNHSIRLRKIENERKGVVVGFGSCRFVKKSKILKSLKF